MSATILNINTIYGEIARDVAAIDNIDTLNQIKRYVAGLLSKQQTITGNASKQEILDDFRNACKEVKMQKEGKASLISFDDMLGSL